MKRALIFFTILMTGFASCKKDDDTLPSKPSYHINGITDVTLQKVLNIPQSPTVYLDLELVYEHSDQETITLTLEGLPQGLKSRFQSSSGIPSFSTTLLLTDSGVAAGNYPLTLVATGTNSGRRTYTFNVSVLAAPDCSQNLVGNGYTSQLYCNSSAVYTQNITRVTGQEGRILFSNFDNTGAQIYANVSCLTGQITIPIQVVNGVTYQGNGYYEIRNTQRYININYYYGSNQCVVQLYL